MAQLYPGHWVLLCFYVVRTPFYVEFLGGGARLSALGTRATIWPVVPDSDGKLRYVWSSRWNDWQGKLKCSEKPVSVPLCPPQIPHDVTWAGTRAASVTIHRLTALVIARPNELCK
jgi:hypothetical protein